MTTMKPADALGELSRGDLAIVARELMLAGHLQDRSSIPAVLAHHSMLEGNEIAIEEWMTTSPVYTQRMHINGTGVDAILKAIQLEIGMPHQFLTPGTRCATYGAGAGHPEPQVGAGSRSCARGELGPGRCRQRNSPAASWTPGR